MALPMRQQAVYWGLAALAFLAVLWVLGPVLLPFVVGGAIAYILDPVADRLQRLGLPRVAATAIITLAALMGLVVLIAVVIPTLIEQTTALIRAAPTYFETLREMLMARWPGLVEEDGIVRRGLADLGAAVQARGGEIAQQLVSGVFGVVGALVFVVVVPVVAFYLLLDWDRMVARIDDLVPRDHLGTVRHLAAEIDATLASFVRGQGTVCLILGTFYSVALMAVGLQFGLVVGAVAGLITFIPYVGAIVGGGLAVGLALFQFWGEWGMIALVAAIFVAGQFVEGNVLTPKLVGDSVGLHPVWLLLALAVFGSLFGFVGMLVAVPVAAAMGVIARFLVAEYKDSLLYRGRETGGLSLREPAEPEGMDPLSQDKRDAAE
jgi:predicted PurR-regulated permease PerM